MNHDDDLGVVLRALRLAGLSDDAALRNRTGWDDGRLRRALDVAADGKLVRHRSGRVAGWSLTTVGRETGQRLALASVEARGSTAFVRTVYAEFLGLNPRALQVCTDWQVRTRDGSAQEINRHDDPVYDADVIGRLVALHGDSAPVVRRLGEQLEEFADYSERLEHSVTATVAGDHDWFTHPLIDSFHSVWFELHEDLLLATGSSRTGERDQRKR